MKLLTRIFLASLIIVKIVLGSIFIYQVGLDPLFLERNAIAAEPQKDPEGVAKEEVQKDPEGAEKPARPALRDEAGGPARHNSGGEDENIVKEEKIDLNFLINKKAELKKEEERLAKKRAELMAIQVEINNKITILTKLRNEIRAQMAQKKTVADKKLKHLIKVYSAMKPQKAARLIEKLDTKFAIELLSNMKGDIVGNLLSFIDTDKAARISEQLVKRE